MASSFLMANRVAQNTVSALYCGHSRDRELVSLIVGMYFNQTSVIYFCRGFSRYPYYRVSVVARCPQGESWTIYAFVVLVDFKYGSPLALPFLYFYRSLYPVVAVVLVWNGTGSLLKYCRLHFGVRILQLFTFFHET